MTDFDAERSAESSEPERLALFRRAPVLRRVVPWLALGDYPTPVHSLEVSGRVLLVKRDDLCAAGYAGNKIRKLEFLLADARARGAARVITAGATGSHHGLATAYHARRLGFDVSLVLFPQRLTDHVRDVLLMQAGTGAELRWARRMESVPFGLWLARQVHRRARPVVVPPGGSNDVGALGYVNAALELAEQIEAGTVPRPDRIHVAAGTLGTVAGMAIGLAWARLDVPIVATRITASLVTNERVLVKLVHATVARLHAGGATAPEPAAALRLVELRHDQIGTGYGHATPAGEQALQSFAAAGLRLDTTYTAKAAAGLLDSARAGVPLFWHTLSAVEPLELRHAGGAAMLPAPFTRYLDRAGRGG
jgi:1-aminocyclopropane-1-carboxylate deaminase/D-cysteine desulfhydrase-like pyridoxal-dependent ACC family enzyme